MNWEAIATAIGLEAWYILTESDQYFDRDMWITML